MDGAASPPHKSQGILASRQSADATAGWYRTLVGIAGDHGATHRTCSAALRLLQVRDERGTWLIAAHGHHDYGPGMLIAADPNASSVVDTVSDA
jgi:hypothetical protein